MRADYWTQVKEVDLNDLVFLDEMGVLLGLMRTHARAAPGERAYDFKPFYRGSKVSVIGAISVSKVLAVMTMDHSMDTAAFEVYVSKCLVPQLWKGAVVVMDNLPAHKVDAIAPLIEAVGAGIAVPVSLLSRVQPNRTLVVTVKSFPQAVLADHLENGRYALLQRR